MLCHTRYFARHCLYTCVPVSIVSALFCLFVHYNRMLIMLPARLCSGVCPCILLLAEVAEPLARSSVDAACAAASCCCCVTA